MRENFEFLKFEETPEAKHFGIAHVRLFKQVALRYRVMHNKEGTGFFIAAPAYKREVGDGNDKWSPWFMLDSQIMSEELVEFIRENINALGRKNQGQQQPFSGGFGQQYQQTSQRPTSQNDGLPF